VIKILDQLVIVVFELLQAVIVIKKFVNCAVLVVEQVFNRWAALAPIVGPEVA